jgi:hypothetical protein
VVLDALDVLAYVGGVNTQRSLVGQPPPDRCRPGQVQINTEVNGLALGSRKVRHMFFAITGMVQTELSDNFISLGGLARNSSRSSAKVRSQRA